MMSAESVVIDSGYNTQMVYDFVKRVRLGYVHAGKGMHGFGVPIVEDQRKRLRRRQAGVIDPQRIGVNEAKLLILNRLQIENPGPGYCHFPLDYDDEYFEQLTAERLVTKFKKGYTTQEFVKTRPRNEALDCRSYALAARKLLPIVLKRHTIDGNKPERHPVKPLVERPKEPRRRSNPYLDGHL
jgi:phage terminase large subunit GpA-like protein